MKPTFTSLLLLFFIPIFAQISPPDIDWEKAYGGKRFDEAFDIIENMDGDFVIVGQAKHLDNEKEKTDKSQTTLDEGGNNDILFLVIDKNKKVKRIKAIGRDKSEGAYALVQTFDGGYAIAGYTNSQKNGGKTTKDAWLLKVDQRGDYLWELRLESPGKDAFKDIIQDANGNLLLCGYQENTPLLASVDRHGKLNWKKKLTSSKTPHLPNALIQLPNKEIAVVGLSGSQRKGKAFFARTNEKGVLQGDFKYFGTAAEEAYDILPYSDKELAIVCRTYQRPSDNLWLLFVDKKGALKRDFVFGKDNNDIPSSFLVDFNKNILITGGSKSHARTGNKTKFFLAGIDEKGKELYSEWPFYGGNYTDYANKIIQSSDGSLYLIGHTFSEKFFKDDSNAWVVKLKSKGFPSQTPATDIVVSDINYFDENKDAVLTTGERAYIQYTLRNPSDKDAFQIKAKVTQKNEVKHIDFPKEIIIGHLPAGSSKTYAVPIKGLEGLGDKAGEFEVSFTEANQAKIKAFPFSIKTKKEGEVLLAIKSQQFIGGNNLTRETPISCQVTLINKGEKTATNLRGIFSFERNVNNLSKKTLKIKELKPGEEYTFKIDFSIDKIYRGKSTKIGFRYFASENNYHVGTQEYYIFGTDIPELSYPNLQIVSTAFNKKEQAIKKGETLEWTIKVKNEGQLEAIDLTGEFSQEEGITALKKQQFKHKKIKEGETKTFSYQFKVKEDFEGEQINLQFQMNASNVTSPTFPNGRTEVLVLSMEQVEAAPALTIIQSSFDTKQPLQDRQKEVKLLMEIQNEGGTAKDLIASFSPAKGIIPIGKTEQTIAAIANKEKTKVSFSFQIDEAFEGNQLNIKFTLKDKTEKSNALEQIIPISVVPIRPARISISNAKITPKKVKPGDKQTLTFALKNHGELSAKDIQLQFEHSKEIKATTKQTQSIASLEAGDSLLISYVYNIAHFFEGGRTDINLSASHQSNVQRAIFPVTVTSLLPPNLVLSQTKISPKGLIKRGETVEFELLIENQGERIAQQLSAVLNDKEETLAKLKAGDTHLFKFNYSIPQDQKEDQITLPFRLSYSDKEKPLLLVESFPLSLEKQAPAQAQLAIKEITLSPNKKTIPRDKTIELKITLENSGNLSAKNIKCTFEHEDFVQSMEKRIQSLPELKQESNHVFRYAFKVPNDFEGDRINIQFSYSADHDKEKKTKTLSYLLDSANPPVLIISSGKVTPELNNYKRGEQYTYTATITNIGGDKIKGLTGRLRPNKYIKILNKETEKEVKIEQGKNHTFKVDFIVSEDCPNQVIYLKFEYQAKHKDYVKPKIERYNLVLKDPESPALSAINQNINGAIIRGKEVSFDITIANTGTAKATGLVYNFDLKKGVKAISELKGTIGELAPDETKKVTLIFMVDETYKRNSVGIGFSFQANEGQYSKARKTTNSFPVQKELAPPPFAGLLWESPMKKDFRDLQKEEITVDLELNVTSNVALKESMFEVFINGTIASPGKAGEEDLVMRLGNKKGASIQSFTFKDKIRIREGKHEIYVKLKTPELEEVSETITLSYKPNTLNLHFLGIGIGGYDHISDLRFPPKDIKDIAKVFKQQEGILFEKVNTFLICDDCENNETNKEGLQLAISGFINDTEEKIMDDDVIVIFISSHGKDIGGKFKLLPSSYKNLLNDTKGDIKALDFEKEILHAVGGLKTTNHRFVFVDACHSGSIHGEDDFDVLAGSKDDISSDISKILQDLLKNEKFTRPMMSCQGEELSWEHKDWENGAFTEALLEAFKNETVKVKGNKSIQASEDNILTFKELYQFLQLRVPFIVNDVFERTQTPYIPDELLKGIEDLPFYRINE